MVTKQRAALGVGLLVVCGLVWWLWPESGAPAPSGPGTGAAEAGTADVPAIDLTPVRASFALGSYEVAGLEPATGTIVGAVTDGEGNPLADATVTLSWGAPGQPDGEDAARSLDGAVVTGATGSFEFGELPPGRYTVTASIAGAAPEEKSAGPGDELLFRLVPKVSLQVLVVDESGAPRKNAKLALLPGGEPLPPHIHKADETWKTDDAGTATLPPRAWGGYELMVASWGYVDEVLPVELGPETPVPFRVVVRRGLSISGRVLWEDGTPVPGAAVHDVLRGAMGMPGGFGLRAAGWADDEGAFLLSGLSEGSYDLWVVADMKASTERLPGELSPRGAHTVLNDVEAGTTDLVVTLRAPGSVTLSWAATGPEGLPADASKLLIQLSLAGPGILPLPMTYSGSPKNPLELTEVPAGTYDLVARASGSRVALLEGLVVPAGAHVTHTLRFSPGNTVSGTLLEADGTPAVAAEARLFDVSHDDAAAWTRARVKDDGSFRIEGRAPRVPLAAVGLSRRPWAGVQYGNTEPRTHGRRQHQRRRRGDHRPGRKPLIAGPGTLSCPD